VGWGGAEGIVGIRMDLSLVAGAAIEGGDEAAVAARIEDIGRPRIARDVAALAATDGVEHLIGAAAGSAGAALRRPARDARGAVVLLGPAHVIRDVLRRDHVVELRR